METRRTEWLASIKPIIDRDGAKKDAKQLAKELGDLLEVKVDASPEGLEELGKEFNEQLKHMGKQPIVFSEKTLRGIVSQFTKAIADGVSAGVSKVDFSSQLEELNQKREKILKAQNKANRMMKARTRMERLERFEIDTAKLMPIDGDVAKEAQQLVDVLYDSADKIDEAAKKYGKSSSHYASAVMDAQEAYNEYLRMQKTLGKMQPSQLSAIPKDVRALYDKLGPDRESYESSGGMNIPFEETFEAEKILDSFEAISDEFEGIIDNTAKYDKMLKQVDAQIAEITRKARESGSIDDGILSGAKDGLKTLNEIEAAYNRLKVDKGSKLRQQNESHIKSALDFDPEKNSVGIKTFAKNYYDAAASGDWVEEYHALLRYVKLYESYLTSTNKTHQNKVTAKNNPFTPLYEQLKPMADNAKNMLQNIINISEGVPLVSMGGDGNGGAGSGPTPEDVANAQKIREASEAKVQAEREALELARKKREEEEKQLLAEKEKEKILEKQRIKEEKLAKAKKASADARKEELGLMQAMDKFQGAFEKTGGKNETLAFINTQTGDMSDFTVGDTHGVKMKAGTSREMSQLGYDMEVHSHSWKTAAPSVEDLESWANKLEYIKKFGIRAGEELLALDFSKLDPTDLEKIIQKYKEIDEKISAQITSMSLDEKLSNFGSYKGIQEHVQTLLRQGLEEILQDIPGVIKSIKMPALPVSNDYYEPQKRVGSDASSLVDVFSNANAEVKELIKNYALLSQKGESMTDDEYDRFIEIGDQLEDMAPDVLMAPASQFKSFAEQLISIESMEDAHRKNTEAITEETQAQAELNSVQSGARTTKLFDAYNQSSDIAKAELQKYLDLFNQSNQLQQTSQGQNLGIHNIYFDATKEQLDNVIAAWKEYRAVIQEISSIQVVNTEDDERRLMELQAKAVGLYNTFKQGRLNDSLADGYVRHYGLSMEDASQMRSDMDIHYGGVVKGFNDSLAKLSSDGVDVIKVLYEVDQELHEVLMNSGSDDLVKTFDLITESAFGAQKAIDNVSEAQTHLERTNDGIQETIEPSVDEQLKKTIALLEKEKLTYEDILALVREYNNNSLWKQLAKSDNWDEADKIFAHHSDIAKKLVPISMMGMGSDSPDKWLAMVGMSAETAAQRLKELYDHWNGISTIDDELSIDSNTEEIRRENEELTQQKSLLHDIAEQRDQSSVRSTELKAIKDENERLRQENSELTTENNALYSQIQENKNDYGRQLQEAYDQLDDAQRTIQALEHERTERYMYNSDSTGDSINQDQLRSVLQSITYNVKNVGMVDNSEDSNNQQENDIITLLTRIKIHTHNTVRQIRDNLVPELTSKSHDANSVTSQQSAGSFALENTLQTVKSVLDKIQTNTANFRIHGTSNIDLIAGTTLDNQLTGIKSVLESINKKIVSGGSIVTRGAAKQAWAQHADSGMKSQTIRSNMFQSLVNDYKNLGKLAAQFANDNNLETQAMLTNLKEEIKRKRQSLRLTIEENANLREKYSIAFNAEKRLLDAETTQRSIDAKNKASTKEIEAAWKKQVKDAQRATGVNTATSVANAGDQTVLRAIGTDEVSKDVENKAKELSDQIKALRILRDEIDKKGQQASVQDRDNLSKQITKVKELKSEVDDYLKIHEKYSSAGATTLKVDTSNFGSVGTDTYWNNITAAIQKVSDGKVVIKGMNADTGELTGTTKIAANTFAQWSAVVDPITGKLSMLRTGIKKTETLVEQITRKTKEIFTYFSGSTIIFRFFNELRRGIQYVREIDLALTELKKVTSATEETYDKFLQTAAKTGARLGSTIAAVTEATATFAKLGYSMEQASNMAEAAIVYKNVGDNIASTEDAADSIISTLKGFGLEASESMAIVDKFNEVGE